MKEMKTLRSLLYLIAASVCSLLFVNCQDDSYLHDSGVHSPYYEGSVLDYLKSRPDYFRQLVEIIDYAGMEDVFQNDDITFFAPSDWSIRSSVNHLSDYLYTRGGDSIKDFRQIKPEVWKDMLSMYIIKDRYLLKDIPQLDTTLVSSYPGQAYYSYSGRPMNIGVVYSDAGGVKYAGSRQILYSYINDFTTMDMKNAYVASCNIQPRNGVVHVIRFSDHVLGFYPQNFRRRAIDEGIIPFEELNNQDAL